MKKVLSTTVLAVAALFLADMAASDEVFAYPPEGRSKVLQQQDQFECHLWAVEQSKFDPVAFAAQGTAASPATSAQKPAEPQNQTGKAVVGGAAAGAAIGEIANNDAGQGAATGAGIGLLRGKMAEKKAAGERAAAEAAAQQKAQQQQAAKADEVRTKQHAYQTARGTCLKGRGYTVSIT